MSSSDPRDRHGRSNEDRWLPLLIDSLVGDPANVPGSIQEVSNVLFQLRQQTGRQREVLRGVRREAGRCRACRCELLAVVGNWARVWEETDAGDRSDVPRGISRCAVVREAGGCALNLGRKRRPALLIAAQQDAVAAG